MLPLQAAFKKFDIDDEETVQMLFRLGRAEGIPMGQGGLSLN